MLDVIAVRITKFGNLSPCSGVFRTSVIRFWRTRENSMTLVFVLRAWSFSDILFLLRRLQNASSLAYTCYAFRSTRSASLPFENEGSPLSLAWLILIVLPSSFLLSNFIMAKEASMYLTSVISPELVPSCLPKTMAFLMAPAFLKWNSRSFREMPWCRLSMRILHLSLLL